MKMYLLSIAALFLLISAKGSAVPLEHQAESVPNGLTIPKSYKKWKLVGVSHRTDKNSLRVILGNRSAHRATFTDGKWNWPDGTILAKLVWKDAIHPQWPAATVPGQLSHIEFMFKDPKKYASTGGWGYARWVGMKREPYQNDGTECFSCHTKVRSSDYVFTRPAPLP